MKEMYDLHFWPWFAVFQTIDTSKVDAVLHLVPFLDIIINCKSNVPYLSKIRETDCDLHVINHGAVL